jgi:serpin B
MMHVYQNFAWQHDASLGAQIVQLPTIAAPEHAESELFCSLYVILPDAGRSLRTVLDQLIAEPLSWRFSYRFLAACQEMSGDVRLPPFRVTSELSFVNVLGRMGLRDSLDGASLSGIAPGLPDFDMRESTTIRVDESGLAATSVDMVFPFSGTYETSSFSFVADHPFIYVLFDELNGAVLYAGVMARPE